MDTVGRDIEKLNVLLLRGVQMEDIIIRNGLIVDVENEKIAKGDISVKDGKIIKICSYIEEHATSEIDADGCYVTQD